MAYKLCKKCGSPILKAGQRRKHPDDYRHAYGCPLASRSEKIATKKLHVHGCGEAGVLPLRFQDE